MKALKIIFIAVIVILGIYIAVCAFMPKEFKVERSTVINAPAASVFEEINDFNNMQHWSPWIEYDPNIQIKVEGIIGEPGYKYSWRSDNDKVGKGSLTRKHTEANKSVSNDLFFEDFKMHSNVDLTLEETVEGTKVTWTNSGILPFMMRPMCAKMERVMAPDLEKGLQRLKNYSEAKPKLSNNIIKIETTTLAEIPYLSVRDTADLHTISQKLGMSYGIIMQSIIKQGLKQAGPIFAIYHSDSETNFDMEPGIPVDKPGKDDGKVKADVIKAGNVVVAHYFGPYEQTGKAHAAIYEWILANNKKMAGRPWEVYITDPITEKDTAKWQTDIYYPIE